MNTDCPLECGVKIKSFYRHMQRCSRKNLFGKEYLKCKYDYNHIVKKEEYERHLEKCDKKCYDSDELEVDLQKVFEKKKKLSKSVEKQEEEVFYTLQSEKINENFIDFVSPNTDNIELLFTSESEIDEDSLNFFNFVYSNY